MTRKTLKITLAAIAALVVALTAGVVIASTKTASSLPEYVGSQACLGCHVDKYLAWEDSHHAVGVKEVKNLADLPADPTGIAPELMEELLKAKYTFHNRFMTADFKTGELKYLGVEWSAERGYYAGTRKGSSFDGNCGGCHAGADYQSGTRVENAVSCESCHGPGREHILNKGDISKISTSTLASQNCAACHSGFNTKPNSPRYPIGYRPGMKLEDANFMYAKVDLAKAPEAMHHKGAYPQWEASGHANATNLLIARGETYLNRQECIYCHSTAAGIQIANGVKFEASKHLVNDGVTCVACHDAHGSTIPGQLKKGAQDLCMSCHSIGRGAVTATAPVIGTVRAPHSPQGDMVAGTGAIGVAATKGAHSDVTCIECHMTDGNHTFKVLKPEHVTGTTRKDACTACHANSSPESRGVYVELWKSSVNSRLEIIARDVAAIEARLKVNANALTADQKKTFENQRANFWYVQKDKSGGAHNFEYAIKILTQAGKEIAKLRTEMK